MSEEEAANPTSYPLSIDEIAAHMQEQNEQDRRDYYMVEGREKKVQDALNRAGNRGGFEWAGVKVVADLECPMYTDPIKPTQDEDTEPTWEEESEAILADAKVRAQFAPLQAVFDGFEDIMRYKNRQYGNTGLEPIGVFSKGDTLEKLLSRADDKVSRIKNSPMLRKNDVVDLMGYLVLICAHQGWNDFTDQQD